MKRFETRRCGYLILAALLVSAALAAGFAAGAAAQCVGDCDGNGKVPISEAQRCVNIRTGAQTLSACRNADRNLDGTVSEAEVDACIQSFLDPASCPGVFTPVPTNTSTMTPTLSPTATSTATFTATETPTVTLTPEPTATATFTPTNTPTSTQTPTNTPTLTQTPTETPTLTPATPIGQVTLTLGASSAATLQAITFPLPVAITGSLRYDIGAPDANGIAAISVPKDHVILPPVDLPGLGTACVSLVEDGSGIIDCDGGAQGIDVLLKQDHNTTPGSANNSGSAAGLSDDPNCTLQTILPTGDTSSACMEKTACGPEGKHAGVCNSPLYGVLSGTFEPGDMRLSVKLGISTWKKPGPDGVFCTPDDTDPVSDPEVSPVTLTTGNVRVELFDTNNLKNAKLNPDLKCGSRTCVAGNTGKPFSCANLHNGITAGSNMGGSWTSLDFTLGDVVISVAFVP
jgi:hypothetical protein